MLLLWKIQPRADLGPHDAPFTWGEDPPPNITSACLRCNLSKGSLTAAEFLASIMARKGDWTVLHRNGIDPLEARQHPWKDWSASERIVRTAKQLAYWAAQLRCPKHKMILRHYGTTLEYKKFPWAPYAVASHFICPFPRCKYVDATSHKFSAAVRRKFREKFRRPEIRRPEVFWHDLAEAKRRTKATKRAAS